MPVVLILEQHLNAGEAIGPHGVDLLAEPGEPSCSSRGGPAAEPLVEILPVHHAYESILDGYINLLLTRGDHASASDSGNDEVIGDLIVTDKAWGDGSAAGFDAASSIE
jgi:hypothetical protein